MSPLSNGIAVLTTSSLTHGMHTIEAKYLSDGTFAFSDATLNQEMLRYPTTATLTSSLNPSTTGQAVTFTAQVASSGGPIPTGTVTFYKGTQALGTVPLNSSAVAQLTTSTLPLGTHPMTAVYNRDPYNGASTSPVLEQVVN